MLKNINEIVFNPGINLLLGKFKSKPAVIVSTGPSLNKNKHLLKGLEDKALIIAADASLKVMLEIDVKPHLVTSLERGPEVATLIDRIKEDLVKEVYFAACPVVCNEVYQAYPGPRIIVYRNFDHFKWLGIERGILNIQLSSGNMSFKVAEALGCDPIILIGQDLAFSREGDTHAEGATYGAKQDFFYQENKKETMGNDGKPIITTDTWYSFLKAYDLDVAAYKGTCVNSTEGGAYIQGTEVMTFQGAIDKFIGDDFHPLQIVKDHLANFSTADAEHDYINVLKLIEKTALDMQCIVDQCKRGTELYNKNKELLIKALSGVSEGDTYKNKVDTIHREVLEPKTKITTDYELTYQLFFMHVLQSFNIKFEMEMIAIPERHEKLETSLAEITLRHSEWYSVVSDLSKILLDLLEKTRQKLLTHKPEAQNLLRRASL